jgi:hypothetical protein
MDVVGVDLIAREKELLRSDSLRICDRVCKKLVDGRERIHARAVGLAARAMKDAHVGGVGVRQREAGESLLRVGQSIERHRVVDVLHQHAVVVQLLRDAAADKRQIVLVACAPIERVFLASRDDDRMKAISKRDRPALALHD